MPGVNVISAILAACYSALSWLLACLGCFMPRADPAARCEEHSTWIHEFHSGCDDSAMRSTIALIAGALVGWVLKHKHYAYYYFGGGVIVLCIVALMDGLCGNVPIM
jgi:hypothetical protein